MNYSKPEVKTLGEATIVIEHLTIKTPPNVTDGPTSKAVSQAAYDLDE